MKDYLGVIFLALLAFFVLYGIYSSSKRKRKLAKWAHCNGLTFIDEKDGDFKVKYPDFSCLYRGAVQYAYNIMKGNISGHDIICCDYCYAYRSDRDLFSLIIVKSPLILKPLLIKPESHFDKLADFAGFNDIDFESAEFSKKFCVKSPDKKWAYDIIHPKMMEFLLTMPAFSIQFENHHIMVYSETTLFSTADFESAINVANGIFDRIPDYVIQNQKLRST